MDLKPLDLKGKTVDEVMEDSRVKYAFMAQDDQRPPLKIDKNKINWDAYVGLMGHIQTPRLVRQVETALVGVGLTQYVIGIYALKVRLNDPELNQAWMKMMEGLAPRGQGKACEPCVGFGDRAH